MEIKECHISKVLPLRMSVLRPGRPIEEGMFPGDEDESTFHLGLYEEDELVTVASFYKEDNPDLEGTGYRLRSMATEPDSRGKGYGKEILKYGLDKLREEGINYLWCNARTTASGFYEKMGFDIISDEFDIPTIGPHYVMKIYLK